MIPLWELQVSMYDRLTANVASGEVYDFLPQQPADSYVFMSEETVDEARDKTGAWYVCSAILLLFTLEEGSEGLKTLAEEVTDAMTAKLVLPSWRTITQTLVPSMRTYRAENVKTGKVGRAAEFVIQFQFEKIV